MIFDKKEFVKQWIEKAKEDKLVIERMTVPEILAPAAVCFHCQQMVEKYLKAYLIIYVSVNLFSVLSLNRPSAIA